LGSHDPAVAAAVEEARTAVLQAPRSARAWARLGMVLAAHQFTAEANQCFAQAERLDPREPRWPYYQGVALSLGDPEAAIPKLQRAVALCENTPDAPRLRLAELLVTQGRYEEAEEQFRHLLQRDRTNGRAHLGLGRLAVVRGDLEQGLQAARLAAADPRVQKAAHLLLAETHQRRGDAGAAAEAYRRASGLPEDPAWPDPFVDEVARLRTGRQAGLDRADDRLRHGRVAEAVALLQQTVRDYPGSDWGWYLLGKALGRQQQWEGSEQALRRAAQLAPGAPEIQFHLGVALFHRKDFPAAAGCFRRATELKPDYALAYHNLGHCLDLQGDRAGAFEAFQSALRCQPDLAEAHAALGELLVNQGRYGEALRHAREAARLNPSDPKAKKLLGRVLGQIAVPIGL
jgi:tetratricopeptide (TPR) repeat protein